MCKFLDIIKHCICYPCSFSFELFANFMHGDLWLVQICWMSYSSTWSPLTWPMVMFILFPMCVRACVSHAYARAHTHTHTLVVCEHVLEYCFICIALADLYYTNNMMAYIYPCSTSIFTHKMLVDGLS